jgi:hypothetical protein
MERRKSVYVKFIKSFWIWQDVYGINDSRWSQALASHWQTLLHNVVYSTPRHERDSNSLVVIDTDCTGSCKIQLSYDHDKDYEKGICWLSAKHTTLSNKSNDWLVQNEDTVSILSDSIYP